MMPHALAQAVEIVTTALTVAAAVAARALQSADDHLLNTGFIALPLPAAAVYHRMLRCYWVIAIDTLWYSTTPVLAPDATI